MPRNTANGMKTQTRTFVYDAITRRLTSATNPENGTVSYTYNADGTLATKHDVQRQHAHLHVRYVRPADLVSLRQLHLRHLPDDKRHRLRQRPGPNGAGHFGSNIGPNLLNFAYNYAYTPAGKVSSKTLAVRAAQYARGYNYASGSVAASYTYDSQGALTQMSYTPGWYLNNAAIFNYTLDAMERPTGMTDNLNYTWVSGASYNAANQINLDGRTYNNLLQVTQVGQMTYNYSPRQNNGQVVSSVDAPTGETITYQYDALKRLQSAAGKNWGRRTPTMDTAT